MAYVKKIMTHSGKLLRSFKALIYRYLLARSTGMILEKGYYPRRRLSEAVKFFSGA